MKGTMAINLKLLKTGVLFALVLSASSCVSEKFDSEKGAKSDILIGWASRDITPEGKVNLAGQFAMRITEKIRDPISVTALAVSAKETNDSFIFVSCDLATINAPLLEESRKIIREKSKDFPVEKLVLNATHTHTSSDIRDGVYDYNVLKAQEADGLLGPQENLKFISGKIADAAIESWTNRRLGKLAWGLSYAVVGRNRRAVYLEDFSSRPDFKEAPGQKIEKNTRMYGKTNNPIFSHIEGYEDHSVQFLFTFDMAERLTGSIINIACPSQETEGLYEISADFWHEVRDLLRKQYGEKLFILPQCSAAGDQSPRLMLGKKAQQRMLELKGIDSRTDIARKIKLAFDDAYEWAPKDISGNLPLKHVWKEVVLSKRKVTEEEYGKNIDWIKQFNSLGELDSKQRRFLSRCKDVVEKYEKQAKGLELEQPVEIHVIRLGDVVFATNPFELFLDYGIRIQARSPATQTFVVQLAGKGVDGGGTYLPTEKAEAGGGYSACVYCNQVGSKGGTQLVEETLKLIDSTWKQD